MKIGATYSKRKLNMSLFVVPGLNKFWDGNIPKASILASSVTRTWTPIVSPSKSVLNPAVTSGDSFGASPPIITGLNAMIEYLWKKGALLTNTG